MVVLYNKLSCVYIRTIHLTVLCIYRDNHGMSMYVYIYVRTCMECGVGNACNDNSYEHRHNVIDIPS